MFRDDEREQKLKSICSEMRKEDEDEKSINYLIKRY